MMNLRPNGVSPPLELDIAGNRRSRKWSRSELIGRLMWECIGAPLIAISPRPFWGVRRAILRLFGAHIGRDVHIYPSVKIAVPWNLSIQDFAAVGANAIIYSLGPIEIGARATISQFSHLCAGTHDYRSQTFDLVKLPIVIGADAWICANAFVGPGVHIGERAIVGACAVVIQEVEPATIVAGNPARLIRARPDPN
jgi:putative colanic acid biosynthesis acetyltransferase WcaF